jgi:Skp family chaperone for outer membrane proteins
VSFNLSSRRAISRSILLAAAMAFTAPPLRAAHAQSPGFFMPPAGQAAPQSTAPAPRGRHGRGAVPRLQAEPPPLAPPPPDAGDPGNGEMTEAQQQEMAAKLPQPPAPPLPPLVSAFYDITATGDVVKVAAVGVGSTLPSPLAPDTSYYLIKGATNQVQLATSADNAKAGTAIAFDSAGAGKLRITVPLAHNGQANIYNDFSVQTPSTLKLLAGGFSPPMPVIGVLGVPDVMRMSNAAQAVQSVIGARKEKLQAEVNRAQQSWQEMKQQLQSDAPKLTREQAVARERALIDRVNADRRRLQDKNRIIQEAGQVALGQIERTLIGIIRQVAESRGMNLVLHRSQVALNVQEFDITEAVALQLNKALPTVQIPPDNVDPVTLPKDWGSPAATPVAAH